MTDRTCRECGADISGLHHMVTMCPQCCVKVMLSAGLEPLVPYPGTLKPWKCRHIKCGNAVAPSMHSIQAHGQGGCGHCAGNARLDPKSAEAVMRAAGLEPLDPYRSVMTPWRSQCLACGKEAKPMLNNIKKGQTGCVWCAENAVDPDDAVAVMRSAGLEPLEPYPGRHSPWQCRCLKCGEITSPQVGAVRNGGGCRWCSVGGFKSAEEAMVYLITHAGYDATKIGITNARGGRLREHRGWQVVLTVRVPGKLALDIESSILRWWRRDLNLPIHLGRLEMPQNGHTETVASSEIDLAETIARIRAMALNRAA